MNKMVYFGALAAIAILTIGSLYFPDSPTMWLASSAPFMIVARLVIGVLIIGLLVTHPPRSILFRSILAITSISLAGWAIVNFFGGGVTFIDSMLFMLAAISFGIAALEIEGYRDIDVSDFGAQESNARMTIV